MIQLSVVIIPGCFPTTPSYIIESRFKSQFSNMETICSLFLRLGVKPFASKFLPNSPDVPLPWNPCRLFQKSILAARHGRPSTARSYGLLWQTFETIGTSNPRRLFQKSIPAARHGRPSTDSWSNRRQESVPFVSKANSAGPSRTSVTARSHELLKQTAPHTAVDAPA